MANGPITAALQRESDTLVLDWNEFMNVVEAADTPLLAMMPEGKPLFEVESNWGGMTRTQQPIVPVPDNTPVTTANHQPRIAMKGVAQQVRETWKVSDWAKHIKTHMVPQGEINFQKSEAMVRERLSLERLFGSTQDCALEGSGAPPAGANQLRAIGRWLEPLAANLNPMYPIADGFRINAACKYTGTLAALVGHPELIQAVILAASRQRKSDVTLDLHAGPSLMATLASFTEHDANATANNFPIKQYHIDGRDNAYLNRVEFFTFPNGKVRAHENFNLFYNVVTGLPTYQTDNGGYLLDMKNGWAVRLMEPITQEDLPLDGSGPRGYYTWKGLLACFRPAGQAVIYPSATANWVYTA